MDGLWPPLIGIALCGKGRGMSHILNFISNNGLASALVAAVVIAVIGGIWKWWHDRKDSETIYNFLLNSKSATGFMFRSTEAISSRTKISEKRVAELCSRHPKIRTNEKGSKWGQRTISLLQ
jgi:hypothetical protein